MLPHYDKGSKKSVFMAFKSETNVHFLYANGSSQCCFLNLYKQWQFVDFETVMISLCSSIQVK